MNFSGKLIHRVVPLAHCFQFEQEFILGVVVVVVVVVFSRRGENRNRTSLVRESLPVQTGGVASALLTSELILRE